MAGLAPSMARGRHDTEARYTSDIVSRYASAIHCFVSTLIRLHDGPIQTHARENAFAAGIGQNLGS